MSIVAKSENFFDGGDEQEFARLGRYDDNKPAEVAARRSSRIRRCPDRFDPSIHHHKRTDAKRAKDEKVMNDEEVMEMMQEVIKVVIKEEEVKEEVKEEAKKEEVKEEVMKEEVKEEVKKEDVKKEEVKEVKEEVKKEEVKKEVVKEVKEEVAKEEVVKEEVKEVKEEVKKEEEKSTERTDTTVEVSRSAFPPFPDLENASIKRMNVVRNNVMLGESYESRIELILNVLLANHVHRMKRISAFVIVRVPVEDASNNYAYCRHRYCVVFADGNDAIANNLHDLVIFLKPL